MISAHQRGRNSMSQTTCHMSISLDGFVAGPDQSLDNPLGVGGLSCTSGISTSRGTRPTSRVRDELLRRAAPTSWAATCSARSAASGTGDWRGWWGDEPPYHAPVFVLTHHAHEPIEMEGGTTFHFVTEGFDAAFARARGGRRRDVDIAGGASTVRQALAAGVIDELVLDFVPVVLGAGERIFDGVADPGLEPIEVIHSPLATHVRYRVGPKS